MLSPILHFPVMAQPLCKAALLPKVRGNLQHTISTLPWPVCLWDVSSAPVEAPLGLGTLQSCDFYPSFPAEAWQILHSLWIYLQYKTSCSWTLRGVPSCWETREQQQSSTHPVGPCETWVRGECLAMPGDDVWVGAEHSCRPTAAEIQHQPERLVMSFKYFPGYAAAEQRVFGLPRYSLKPRVTGF